MRSIVVFGSMTIFIYLYSYIVGGESSMLMLYVLLIAPVVSIILTLPVWKRINITFEAPSAEVEKDGLVKVKICIQNRSFLPIPFIDVTYIQVSNFSLCGPANRKISIGSFETKTIVMEYIAKRRGIAQIGIKSIILRDYLGFLSLSLLKNMEAAEYVGEITVLPRLFNIKSGNKIMLGSGHAHVPVDSGESSTGMFSWTGEPGYEFREFVAGDSLHKIHWKLSAKKEALMVRKDEGRGIPKKFLIVDPCVAIQDRKPLKKESVLSRLFKKERNMKVGQEKQGVEDKILESLLAIAHVAVKTGRDAEVWLFEGEQWIKLLIKERKNISELQHKLAAYQFVDANTFDCAVRLPLLSIIEQGGRSRNFSGGEAIVFTGSIDKPLLESIDNFFNYGMVVDMVMVKNSYENNDPQGESQTQPPELKQGNVWMLGVNEDMSEVFS